MLRNLTNHQIVRSTFKQHQRQFASCPTKCFSQSSHLFFSDQATVSGDIFEDPETGVPY